MLVAGRQAGRQEPGAIDGGHLQQGAPPDVARLIVAERRAIKQHEAAVERAKLLHAALPLLCVGALEVGLAQEAGPRPAYEEQPEEISRG